MACVLHCTGCTSSVLRTQSRAPSFQAPCGRVQAYIDVDKPPLERRQRPGQPAQADTRHDSKAAGSTAHRAPHVGYALSAENDDIFGNTCAPPAGVQPSDQGDAPPCSRPHPKPSPSCSSPTHAATLSAARAPLADTLPVQRSGQLLGKAPALNVRKHALVRNQITKTVKKQSATGGKGARVDASAPARRPRRSHMSQRGAAGVRQLTAVQAEMRDWFASAEQAAGQVVRGAGDDKDARGKSSAGGAQTPLSTCRSATQQQQQQQPLAGAALAQRVQASVQRDKPPEHAWMASSALVTTHDALHAHEQHVHIPTLIDLDRAAPDAADAAAADRSEDSGSEGSGEVHEWTRDGRHIGSAADNGNVMDFWRALGLTEAQVVRVLTQGHVLQGRGDCLHQGKLVARVRALARALECADTAEAVARRCPDVLVYSAAGIAASVYVLRSHFGAPATCALAVSLPLALTVSSANLEAVLEFLEAEFGADAARAMLARSPHLLTRRLAALRDALSALRAGLGRDAADAFLRARFRLPERVLLWRSPHIAASCAIVRACLPDMDLALLLERYPGLLLAAPRLPAKVQALAPVLGLPLPAQLCFFEQLQQPAVAGRVLSSSLRVLQRVRYVAEVHQKDGGEWKLSVATIVTNNKTFRDRYPGYQAWEDALEQAATEPLDALV